MDQNISLLNQFDDNRRHFPRYMTIIAATCAILFSVIGFLGNLATVIALMRYARLRRHATTAFVISLSISDLIFSAVNLPLTSSRYLNEAWVLGETLCQIFPLFFYGNVAVSLLSMVAITINRYVLISKPEAYASMYTSRRITWMLIAIWLMSFALLTPPLFGIWGTLGLDAASFSCTILEKNGRSPKKLLFMIGFVIPCLVITVSYLCIYWHVRQSRQNLEAHVAKSTAPSKLKRNNFSRRDDTRVTRLMLTIFVCFLLCFLPLMLVNVIDDKMRLPKLHIVASILAWASAVINPFIYAATNKLYRQAYKKLFCVKEAPRRAISGNQFTSSKIST